MPLILASASPIRRTMLDQARVDHQAIAASIDEASIKERFEEAHEAAAELAGAKALRISNLHPSHWVIGSDSIATVEKRMFDKPADRQEAAEHLRFFSGRTMRLTSAVALAIDRKIDWFHVETAILQVRTLSAGFIEDYLESEWPAVGSCVGVFRMEGEGVQLFDKVEGSHFTILGMPLVPLLGALRQRGILPS